MREEKSDDGGVAGSSGSAGFSGDGATAAASLTSAAGSGGSLLADAPLRMPFSSAGSGHLIVDNRASVFVQSRSSFCFAESSTIGVLPSVASCVKRRCSASDEERSMALAKAAANCGFAAG